jgi:hypothetical protein
MGTTNHRRRHSLLAKTDSKRGETHPATSAPSSAPIRFRTLGRIGSRFGGSGSRPFAQAIAQNLSRYRLARGTLAVLCLTSVIFGCERAPGSTPAEFLGGVSTELSIHSTPNGTSSTDGNQSRDDRLKAINEFAQGKKLLTVERLSAEASVKYPNDTEFKLINARALLDLGRTEAAKKVLKPFLKTPAHSDEARFLTAIALLSDLQRSGSKGPEAQSLFVRATTLLYSVVQTNPNFTDRFPPKTHINQVRQGLTQYAKALDFERLSVEALGSETAVLAMLDVLKRLNKHSVVSSLLKAAHLKYPDSNSLWLSRAELHLTQNEPLVALEFINQVQSFQDLTSEELLTYAAGQIAAAKQLKKPGIRPFARSYRALLIAEALPEESAFKTLIPRVKKTIFGLLPKGVETQTTEALSPVEKTAFLRMLKDAGLQKR